MAWKVKQMTDREKVIKGLECLIVKELPCDKGCPYYGTGNCSSKIAKDVRELLEEQESEWLEDSDPGQEYGTTWACRKCMHSIHRPYIWNPYDSGYKYCPHCGAEMKVKLE